MITLSQQLEMIVGYLRLISEENFLSSKRKKF